MMQCDGCSERYHMECERSIPQRAVKSNGKCRSAEIAAKIYPRINFW